VFKKSQFDRDCFQGAEVSADSGGKGEQEERRRQKEHP